MADQDTSKANKRRSLLMPRGTLANASVSRIASPTKQRPISMMGLDPAAVRELSSIQTPGEAPMGLRKPMVKSSAEPAKPASGIARSSSLRQPAAGSIKPGHTRQQSVTKQMPTVKEGPAARPSKMAPPTRTTSSRIGHTRTGSSIATPVSTTSSSTNLPAPTRPTSMLLPPSSRPAFSTLQQHYSPLKARGPKPTSTSLIHPPAVETPPIVSLDTSFLQTHLMQLSILHSSFHPTYAEWCASTRHAMRRKFADVAARAEITQERERVVRGRANAAALSVWGGGMEGMLGENVQTLAMVLQDVDVLCDEKSGKVAAMISGFAGWFEAVRELWSLRTQVEDGDDGEAAMEFVDGLGAAWRQDVAMLIRRLGGLRSMMDGLESPQANSTVAEVVACVAEIIRGAIEELELMAKIEKIVGEQEKAWVDARLDRVIAELDLDGIVNRENGEALIETETAVA